MTHIVYIISVYDTNTRSMRAQAHTKRILWLYRCQVTARDCSGTSLSFALCDPRVSLSCVSRGFRMSRIRAPRVFLSCVPPVSLSCLSSVPFVSLELAM